MKPRVSGPVVLAIDKQHFNVTAAQKWESGYRAVSEASIMLHFGAGLREDIKRIVLGTANPPDTGWHVGSSRGYIEAELAKTRPLGVSTLVVAPTLGDNEEEGYSYKESLVWMDAKVEELAVAVQWFWKKPLDRSKIQCYNCHRFGHFQ